MKRNLVGCLVCVQADDGAAGLQCFVQQLSIARGRFHCITGIRTNFGE